MAYPKSPLARVNGLFVCFANGRTEQGVQIYGIFERELPRVGSIIPTQLQPLQ